MKVIPDYDACEANAVCAGLVPEVFEVDDDDNLNILVDEIPDEPGRGRPARGPVLPQGSAAAC